MQPRFAHSRIQFKAVDAEQRVIEGIASTPTPDRGGDVMDPKGAVYSVPMPLLWQHKADKPIGRVLSATVTKTGIKIRAQIAKGIAFIDDEVWPLIKDGLVPGLSIGWRPIEGEPLAGGLFKFTKWDWYETSTVTVPMNAETTITAIKSADAAALAASGTGSRASVSSPGVPGRPRKDTTMNVSEQLTARKAELKTKTLRLEELMGKDDLDTQEVDERDALTSEIKGLSGDVERLSVLEKARAASAVSVIAAPAQKTALDDHGRTKQHVSVEEPKLPPGIQFVRMIGCQVAAALGAMQGHFKSAQEIARERYPSSEKIQLALKAAVAPATTTDSTWAGPFVYAETIADFVDYLRPMTILGKFGMNGIPSLNRVPFNSRAVSQTSGGTGYWVGQGKPKPVTKFDYSAATLSPAKVAAIVALADELFRFGNHPSVSAETAARNGLVGALREVLDTDFIDPAKAASANVSPASITNGVTALGTTGTDADHIRGDINLLLSTFITNNVDPTNLVLIMPNTLALQASLIRNGLGQKEFPDLTMNGGFLEGIPVIASQYARVSGSNLVIAVNAEDIYLADDGQVTIDLSREASIEMNDSPTQDGSAGTGASLVSLWQNNLVGLRAERFINWSKRRSTAVAYMDDVTWGSVTTG